MLAIISSWIKQIILVVMFTTFIDLLMPNNKITKYGRIVLGLIVVITIVNPLLVFFKGDFALDKIEWEYKDLIDQGEILTQVEAYNDKNNQLINQYHIDNLKSLIVEYIEQNSQFEVINIDVQLAEDKSNGQYKSIEKLNVSLKDKSQEIDVKIDDIKFRQNSQLNELKNSLNQNFNIPFKNIYLNLEG